MEQMSRQIVFDYIKKKYGVQPNFPWRRDRTSAVFRHTDNKKWFALMMTVDGEKVGLPAGDPVDVINLKMDDMFYRDLLIREGGIIPAYHMNRMHWITVFLNGRMPAERIFELINFANDQTNMRITTGMLNDVLTDAQMRVQPPTDKGRRLKIYYMTQTGVRPPSFVVFCNRRDLFHFSYQRYLENQIRAVFGLEGTPIRMVIRQKGDTE